MVQPRVRVAREENYTDFLRSDRGDVDLTIRAPVDLHAIRPRRDTIVPAEAKAAARASVIIETGPAPDARILPVRPNDPARPHKMAIERDSLAIKPGDPATPDKMHAGLCGSINHQLVQHSATHPQPAAGGKA